MKNMLAAAASRSSALRLMAVAALVGITATILMIGSTPARAVSCDDVRGLTKVEQNYWAKRLNLTADQRHQIWLACYGQSRLREAKTDDLQTVTDRH